MYYSSIDKVTYYSIIRKGWWGQRLEKVGGMRQGGKVGRQVDVF